MKLLLDTHTFSGGSSTIALCSGKQQTVELDVARDLPRTKDSRWFRPPSCESRYRLLLRDLHMPAFN
jgi:hypothetical protein